MVLSPGRTYATSLTCIYGFTNFVVSTPKFLSKEDFKGFLGPKRMPAPLQPTGSYTINELALRPRKSAWSPELIELSTFRLIVIRPNRMRYTLFLTAKCFRRCGSTHVNCFPCLTTKKLTADQYRQTDRYCQRPLRPDEQTRSAATPQLQMPHRVAHCREPVQRHQEDR